MDLEGMNKILLFTLFNLFHYPVFSEVSDANQNVASSDSGQLEEQGEALQSRFNDFNEINGVIVDRTMTRLGEQFYFFFSQQMNEQYVDINENFTVEERPTALRGSIVTIIHSRKPIYRTALSPGQRKAKEKAQEAVSAISNYIVRWEAERQYLDTFDMEHDEF